MILLFILIIIIIICLPGLYYSKSQKDNTPIRYENIPGGGCVWYNKDNEPVTGSTKEGYIWI